MVITVQEGVAMTATLKWRCSRQHRHDDTPGHQHPATPQSTNLTEYLKKMTAPMSYFTKLSLSINHEIVPW